MENQDIKQDELDDLKDLATGMGIKFHPNIGIDALKDRINEASKSKVVVQEDEEKSTPKKTSEATETQGQKRARKRREASELVRIRVTCMNPFKREWEGEFFTVGNSVVGTFTKYVPFNNDEGWHVPRIIYNQIKSRKCQIFRNEKSPRGGTRRVGQLINEFAVEELPKLTEKELKELAQRQAMARGTAQ